ncbi:hypothetical protein Bbelb_351700 [Branchiostoma belcheri]|nr:hypothetical protein Bbelb_351700 [Branchiostoma belcheri]
MSSSALAVSRTGKGASGYQRYSFVYPGSFGFVGLTIPIMSGGRERELHGLRSHNDILANYIEKVRILEDRNRDLELQYAVLSRAPISAAGGAGDQNQQMIDAYNQQLRKADGMVQELRNRRDMLEQEVAGYEVEVNELTAQIQAEMAAIAAMEEELSVLKKSVADANAEGKRLQGAMEMLSVNLDFQIQANVKEAEETRERVTLEVQQQAEAEFQVSVESMRKEFEANAGARKAQLEEMYARRLAALQTQKQRLEAQISEAKREIKDVERQIQQALRELDRLRETTARLQAELEATEIEGIRQYEMMEATIAELEAVLNDLRDRLQAQRDAYSELQRVKMQMDMEITCYKQLLEGEEARSSCVEVKM